MTRPIYDVDVSDNPALLRVAEEVHTRSQPWMLRAGTRALAMLVPVTDDSPPATRRHGRVVARPPQTQPVAPGGASEKWQHGETVVTRTAGILRAYVQAPGGTAEEDRAETERAIAADVITRMDA